MRQLRLFEVINALSKESPDKVLECGFTNPHSYRGYHDELSFAPKEYVSVKDMLECAESAMGATYWGYKGEPFEMGPNTPVWIAEEDCGGKELTSEGLTCMLLSWDDRF